MSLPLTTQSFAESLIAELVSAVGAVVGGVVAAPAPSAAQGDGWQITATATGALAGPVVMWVDQAGAELMARSVMGMDDAPDQATVTDMLGEMWSQAAGALATKPGFTDIELALTPAAAGAAPPSAVWVDLTAQDRIAHLAVGVAAVVIEASPNAGAVTALAPKAAAAEGPASELDAVLDIELPLIVRFARTVMPLKMLLALGPGSIIDMERSPDEPVQMLVGERLIARGEIVVVGGNYGVRVTDLVSPTERVRALEA